ncbi:MAG: amino acid permease, partial [Hyphomicrobiaceae bacterium]
MDPQEEREHRDRGLVQVVGPVGLAANVTNIVIGAGIFVLPAAIAAEIGSAAPLAYAACAVVMGAVALCFAEAGSRVPTSGGPYGYA